MAKKHVILRYIQAENEYKEMNDLLNELKEDIKNNKISQEYYDEKSDLIYEEIERIKIQYLFWAEAVFELNKPNKKGKDTDKFFKDWYKTLEGKTRECLIHEDNDPTKTLKDLLKEGKL